MAPFAGPSASGPETAARRVSVVRLVAVAAFFALTTAAAFLQPPRPSPLHAPGPTEPEWWLYPIEVNAWRRAPILSHPVQGLHVDAGGEKIWAVGDAGLILHSADGGRTWAQQTNIVGFSTAAPPQISQAPSPPSRIAALQGEIEDLERELRGYEAQGKKGGRPDPKLDLVIKEAGARLNAKRAELASLQNAANQPAQGIVGRVNAVQGAIANMPAAANLSQAAYQTQQSQSNAPAPDTPSDSGSRGGGFGPPHYNLALRAVAFDADARTGVAVGDAGHALATTDGGGSWRYIGFDPGRVSGGYRSPGAPGALTHVGFVPLPGVPPPSAFACNQELGFFISTASNEWGWYPSASSPECGQVRSARAVGLVGALELQWTPGEGPASQWAVGADGAIWRAPQVGGEIVRQTMGAGEVATFLGEGAWRVTADGRLQRAGEKTGEWLDETTQPVRFPAPWYYVALLATPFLLRRVVVEAAPPAPTSAVANAYASDRPLRAGDPDAMSLGAIARGLSAFLRNENTEPPLTIAITGAWGTGKSSLMNLLESDLRRHRYRPIWFNAWHHQNEEQMLAAILEAVRRQAVPGWLSGAGLLFRVNLLWVRISRSKPTFFLLLATLLIPLGFVFAGPPIAPADVLDALVGKGDGKEAGAVAKLIGGGSLLSLVVFAATAFVNMRSRLDSMGFSPVRLLRSLTGGLRTAELRAQLGYRARFAAEFRDVADALKPVEIVALIDDLDRCQPGKVLEVLEAVNFLLSSGDCYVVMGMDYEWVERCVGLAYKEVAEEMVDSAPDAKRRRIELGRHYLEKLVNIQIPVPVMSPEQGEKLAESAQVRAAEEETRQGRARRRRRRMAAAGAAWLVVAAALAGFGFVVGDALRVAAPPSGTAATQAAAPVVATGPGGAGGAPASAIRPDAPPAVAARPAEPLNLQWLIGLAAAAIALAISSAVLIEVWRRRAGAIVRDSEAFTVALKTWLPALLKRRSSPRALKRFMNRVRYFAMRQAEAPEVEHISEPLLVALGALHQIDPSLLYAADIRKEIAVRLAPSLDPAKGGPALQAADAAIHATPGWPPTPAQAQAFLVWCQGIHVR